MVAEPVDWNPVWVFSPVLDKARADDPVKSEIVVAVREHPAAVARATAAFERCELVAAWYEHERYFYN